MSHYMIVVLGATPRNVFLLFTFTSVTAPTLGLLLGGYISDRIGGYTGQHALLFCLIAAVFGSLVGLPIPFLDSYFAVTFILWLMMFFGSGTLPTLTGLMISSLTKEHRSLGNALAQFVFNLLGYIPAPFIYGYLTSRDPSKLSRPKEPPRNGADRALVVLARGPSGLRPLQVAAEAAYAEEKGAAGF